VRGLAWRGDLQRFLERAPRPSVRRDARGAEVWLQIARGEPRGANAPLDHAQRAHVVEVALGDRTPAHDLGKEGVPRTRAIPASSR